MLFEHTYLSLVPECVYARIGKISSTHFSRHGILSTGAVSEEGIRGEDGVIYHHAIAVYSQRELSSQDLARLFPGVPGDWEHVDHRIASTVLQ